MNFQELNGEGTPDILLNKAVYYARFEPAINSSERL